MDSTKLINLSNFLKILPRYCLKPVEAGTMVNFLNYLCPKYGISNQYFTDFLATIISESDELRIFKEPLYFPSPMALCNKWPKLFPTSTDALPYIKNPQSLADKVYGNNFELGNLHPGDGWNFIGRGYLPIKGRNEYEKFSAYKYKPLEAIMVLLEESVGYNLDVSCWAYTIRKKRGLPENVGFKNEMLEKIKTFNILN